MSSTELRIQTPEGIEFAYALAGPVSRCLAWMVDFVVVLVILFGFSSAARGVFIVSEDAGGIFLVVGYFVIWLGYTILCEWKWRGQTVGKRFFRLRVMDVEGLRLQFHQVLLRNLLRAVDSLPFCYLVGGIACLASRQAQRLGDLAAATVVVHLPQQSEPDLEQLMAGRFNSFRAYPHIAARLRQRISPAEASMALQSILRREEFESGARVTLFRALADHFREAVPFPPEAAEAISDEQYVRNVVDILFRTRSERV